ncbi:hypothetical protein V2J09_009832 [Rumex salicifolius]
MSWLVNSIANSLKPDEDDEGDDEDAIDVNASAGEGKTKSTEEDESHALSPSDDDVLRTGVKEDLSEFSKTLTRQLWGVASFLTPPPSDSHISDPNPQPLDGSESFDQDGSNSARIDGIRSDLLEIGGKFRVGISKLSSNKAVSEFSKIASNILQFVSEEGETLEDYARQGVVGVTEEVVAFARDVAMHPQTWLDFPLPDDHDEEEDFAMSEIQQEHTFAVERLAPRLAALRMRICPGHMKESRFWKIYFVLVHPRLTSQEAELLSTSQIVKARAMLTKESQISNSIPDGSGRGTDSLPSESPSSTNDEHLTVTLNNNPKSTLSNVSVISQYNSTDTANTVVDKHTVICTEIPVIDEDYTANRNHGKSSFDLSKGIDKKRSEDAGSSGVTDIPIEDGDVSFSDLEEDIEIPIK